MKWTFFAFLFLCAGVVKSQDLTGIWRGSFNSSEKIYDLLGADDRYKFEVQLENHNKSFTGVTYSYKTTVFYGKAVATGTINQKTGKVMLQETKIVELKMAGGSSACIMTCFLQYSKNGNEEFLEGKYSSYNEQDSTPCGKGTVLLRKVVTSDFYKEPFLARAEENKKKDTSNATKIVKATPKAVPHKTLAKITVPKKGTTHPQPNKNLSSTARKTPLVKSAAPPVAKSITKPPVAKNSKSNPTTGPLQKNNDAYVKKDPQVKIVTPKGTVISPRNETRPPARKDYTDTLIAGPLKNKQPFTLPEPLATRSNELVKAITVNSNDVTISVYDNGAIDHDTVSIYLDKKLVISKRMLTAAPIIVKLKLDENNAYHELILVAENLGDIPPNTSLMVVKAGDKEFEVHISSTEQKNAVVIFKYEKE